MRLFIGFLVPEKIKEYAIDLQSNLKNLPMRCKMVEPYNIHVCLSFLGNVSDTEIKNIQNALKKICEGRPKFELTTGDIKLIPSKNFIRVIVLDVLDSSKSLKNICSAIKEKIGGHMKPPHLTLCRVKNISNKDNVLNGIEKLKGSGHVKNLIFVVNSISLIKSELSRSGPRYSVIYDVKLAG